METQDKNRFEPQGRFAEQNAPVHIDELVEKTLVELSEASISAAELAARFAPLFANAKLPLAHAIAVLDQIDAPAWVVSGLKYHAHLDVLCAVDAARDLGLVQPYSDDASEFPHPTLFGYALDWDQIRRHANRIGKFRLDEARELGLEFFDNRGADVAVSLSVVDGNVFLRGFYTLMWLARWSMESLPMQLGEVFFAGDGDDEMRLSLQAPLGSGRVLSAHMDVLVTAHGRVGEKYWVFFMVG